MACYAQWSKALAGGYSRPMSCGQCHGCRLERARQAAVRCMHEAKLHDENCMLTLTYKDEKFSLDHRDFQLFMKRLRARFPRVDIRFYMCGEYGEAHSRAHFHCLLFGFNFRDRVYWRKSPSGATLFRSSVLESLWTAGFSTIGEVTFESASYVARYIMKKLTGDDELHRLGIVDPDSGEIFWRTKEYSRCSLRPAIGKRWIERFMDDVYPSDEVLMRGQSARPPRYYDDQLRKRNAGRYMRLKEARHASACSAAALAELAPGRLEAREAVSRARVGLSKRKLT